MNEDTKGKKVIIIGAGPAGLTSAYELEKSGIKSTVLEKDTIVGGISRTVNYKEYRFDIGGHRFFTKVTAVENLWREILKEDFIRRNRVSRIYYNKKFFDYPLRASNALFGLGVWNSLIIFISYLKAQIFPEKPEKTFEQWVSNRFGKRLFLIFFKTYTEKVWGMSCREISAEWATQRIKGLSLISALKNALIKPQKTDKNAVIKTLIDAFDYPKHGPGMMWEKVSHLVEKGGSEVRLNADVKKIHWTDNYISAVEVSENGERQIIEGTDFISSMPVRELVRKLEPAAPEKVLDAASKLKYRDFLTVALVVNKANIFHDNWIYIHEPEVKVGRVQNFKNWSPDMVPDQNKTCLGLEYFCFEGDGLWTMSDKDLIDLGRKELDLLGLIQGADVEDGAVVRMPKAYPVYDSIYQEALKIIRNYLDPFKNLQLVGRNGMHKYNNQDHSMLTAMLAVKNIQGANYDLWKVNADQEYHEKSVKISENSEQDEFAKLASSQPRIPTTVLTPSLNSNKINVDDESIIYAFSRFDKFGFAMAVGTVCGMVIFLATVWLTLSGDTTVTTYAELLNQYFFGYSVTMKGAFIGLFYGMSSGFIWGWLFAYLRNFIVGLYVYMLKKNTEMLTITDFFDHY